MTSLLLALALGPAAAQPRPSTSTAAAPLPVDGAELSRVYDHMLRHGTACETDGGEDCLQLSDEPWDGPSGDSFEAVLMLDIQDYEDGIRPAVHRFTIRDLQFKLERWETLPRKGRRTTTYHVTVSNRGMIQFAAVTVREPDGTVTHAFASPADPAVRRLWSQLAGRLLLVGVVQRA